MGQVFRFVPLPNGGLAGAEGDLALVMRELEPGVWEVETNKSQAAVESFFRLDQPPKEVFRQVCQLDPRLAELAPDGSPSFTLLRPTSLNEAIFGFLCSQNNHLARIMSMTQHLGSMGERLGQWGLIELTAFPSLETLSRVSPDELKLAGFGYRASHIPASAQAILDSGEANWLSRLKAEPYEDAVSLLCSLPGIGRKLAECILLYGADRTESVPVDTHLWRMAAPLYLPNETENGVSPARSARLSCEMRERFGSLAGWAHLLLFAASLYKGPSKIIVTGQNSAE